MKRSSCVRALAFCVVGTLGLTAFAEKLMPTGNATTDTANIKNALNSAGNGVVELGEGEFLITGADGITLSNGVTIKGQGFEKTIIKSALANCNRGIKLTGGSKLQGLTITGFKGGYRGAGVYADYGEISWCCVSNNVGSSTGGTASGGGIGILRGKVDHSIIAFNSCASNSEAYGAGVGGTGLAGDVVIDSCLFYGNVNNGKNGGGAIGMNDLKSHTVSVRNCTIVGNSDNSKSGGVYVNGNNALLDMKNCIVVGNTTAGAECNYLMPESLYESVSSCLFGLQSESEAVIDSQYGDPGFVNSSARDYHLILSSPAVQAGEYYAGLYQDLDGALYASNNPSLGCYEVDFCAAKPVFSPAEGRTFYPTLDVEISSSTAGATIRYTTDGSDPSETSAVYSGTPIVLTETTTIKARAYAEGYEPSPVVSAIYTYALPTPPEFTVSASPWSSTVTLEGAATSLGNNGATACDVYVAYGPADGSLGAEQLVASGMSISFKHVISGLTPETTYQYSVRLLNNGGVPQDATQTGTFTTLSAKAGLLPVPGDPDSTTARLQDAIDAAVGGIVYLAEATFEISAPLTINNNASLVGAEGCDRENVIIKQTATKVNVIKIVDSPDTVLSNLTVTAVKNGRTAIVMNSGVIDGCVIRDIDTENNAAGSGLRPNDTASAGGGVNMCGTAVLRNSLITRCNARDSGGMVCPAEGVYLQDGLIENCQITYCGQTGDAGSGASGNWGGAVCIRNGGTLRGCLIANNRNKVGGTGVTIVGAAKSTGPQTIVENCTIVGNKRSVSDSNAIGVYIATDFGYSTAFNVILRNNIIWGNVSLNGETEANYNLANLEPTTCLVENCDSRPAIDGDTNVSIDPMFVDAANDDFHLGLSYIVDGGANQDWMIDAVDMDGTARILNGTVDLGCYEFDPGESSSCKMRAVSDGTLDLAVVTLSCDMPGEMIDSAEWLLVRRQDGEEVRTTGTETTVRLPVGTWDARVDVTAGSKSASAETPAAVVVGASSVYVNESGSNEFPYDTVEKGAASIDEAFPLVGFGGTLYVAAGNYVISKPIVIEGQSGSRIVSLSGPESTIIRMADVEPFNGTGRNYGMRLSDGGGYLCGITLVGGRPSDDYMGESYSSFGLLKVESAGAVVTNCVFRDFVCSRENSGWNRDGLGLLMTAGTVVDCVFSRIDHYTSGGSPAWGGIVLIRDALADRLRVEDCWDNSADTTIPGGGGDIVAVIGTGVLRNSLVTRCSSNHGVPVYAGTAPGATPGSSVAGTIINCTVVANTNSQMKVTGAVAGVQHPYSHEGGVNVVGGSLVNSIVADNWSGYEGGFSNLANYFDDPSTGVSYTLVTDRANDTAFVTEENHNIGLASSDGVFHRPLKGDFTLAGHSVAINAGLLQDWMETAADLDGRARVTSKIPDLGCYEARGLGFAIRLR